MTSTCLQSAIDLAANAAYAKYFTLYKDLYKTVFSSFKDLKNI